MKYVMSDIHGNYNKYIEMLELINFKKKDTLYILGDIIDRGNQNIAMLRDVMLRENVVMLMGNHEDMMIEAKKPFGFIDKNTWYYNGGDKTDEEFSNLNIDEQQEILNYISKLPVKVEIKVGGIEFILVHGSYKSTHYNFFKDKTARQYKEDLMWNRIKVYEEGIAEKIVIFGHTPTCEYQKSEPYKIWYNKNKNVIGIDCGMAAYNRGNKNSRLGCLRLNDMQEFYV